MLWPQEPDFIRRHSFWPALFAGVTYVPLNPNYPVLRTRGHGVLRRPDVSAGLSSMNDPCLSYQPVFDGQIQQSSHSWKVTDEPRSMRCLSVASTVYCGSGK